MGISVSVLIRPVPLARVFLVPVDPYPFVVPAGSVGIVARPPILQSEPGRISGLTKADCAEAYGRDQTEKERAKKVSVHGWND